MAETQEVPEETGWFRVIQSNPRCEHCGEGARYSIISQDGVDTGTEYSDQDQAEDEADTLNWAFDKGRMSR